MAIFNKKAGAAVALLLSILIAIVVLGGAGLQDGFRSISGLSAITGAVPISYCTGTPPACSSLDIAKCVAAGCSWSTGECTGGELKACNLFPDKDACETQSGCAWVDGKCRTFGTRADCNLIASESCSAQITANGDNCVWNSGCFGAPKECSSHILQSTCEMAGCQWATCEGINFYGDFDGDGYGNSGNMTTACTAPPGYVERTDCNDADANVNVETIFYADLDDDKFGNLTNNKTACTQLIGYVNDSADCGDNNVTINPNATEVCDGIDNNCNGQIDDGVRIIFYGDTDNDGFGDLNNKTEACAIVVGYTNNSLDCNDKDDKINPNATEICNAVDDNCANGIDELFDVDKDGFFNATLCGNVTIYANKLDPADSSDKIYPGAAERCDGLDNDANAAIDDIGGKIIASETKCACTGKTESQIADIKQAKERLNGEDDNCDGRLASEEADADADGFATYQGDCDDFNRNVNPKAAESCVNKIDDNCNGKVDDVSEGCTAPKQNPATAITNPALRAPAQETQQATSIGQQVLKGEQISAAAAAAAKQAEQQAALAASAALGEEKAGFSPSWLFLPIGLVPLVILLAYLFYIKPRGGFGKLVGKKKKEEFVEEEFPAEESAKPTGIDSYISDTLAQGYSAEEIKKALLDKGWTEDAIEEAFRKQGL